MVSNFEKTREHVEKGSISPQAEKATLQQFDISKAYNNVFSTPEGQVVLKSLEEESMKLFPNYNNVHHTYSKIGEQNLVKHIKAMMKLSKKE